MPDIFLSISVWLAKIVPAITGRVLGAIGMGVISYTGVQAGMDLLVSKVTGAFGGIAADIIGLAALAGFDVFISLQLSAMTGIISFLVVAGSIKRLGFAATEG